MIKTDNLLFGADINGHSFSDEISITEWAFITIIFVIVWIEKFQIFHCVSINKILTHFKKKKFL